MNEEHSSLVEMSDPFQGQSTTHEEFSKWRETGELPERFKPASTEQKEAEAPAAKAETEDGTEPPKEAEQEKQGEGRDEKGKFTSRSPEGIFNPEQQKIFDRTLGRRVAKREAEIRQEYEAKYRAPSAEQTSKQSGPAPAEEPTINPDGSPREPVEPKEIGQIGTFHGTVEEYESALKKYAEDMRQYAAKKAHFEVATREFHVRKTAREKITQTSADKMQKAHPDFRDEYEALLSQITKGEETALPSNVAFALQFECEHPHQLTYYFAKNRDEIQRFAELTPTQAMRELGKLEEQLSRPAPVKKEPDPKPKPYEPVGARASSSAFDVNDEKLDPDEWARQRNEQVAKRRR